MAPNAGGFDQGWSVNDPCFFKDEARGWILGRVTKVVGVGRTATLSLASTDGKVTAERDASAVEAASARARCLLYTSPSPRDVEESRMPSSA